MTGFKKNAKYMAWALTKAGSPFHYRKHFLACPNLSWGLLNWEADLAVFTKSGFLWEIEIKISESDWKQDQNKQKWTYMDRWRDRGDLTPKRFYYAAPQGLAERWSEIGIPEWAGVVSVEESRGRVKAKIIKECKDNGGARKATESELLRAARLSSMRYWSENAKKLEKESS
jgi:hypothetical protein